MDNLFAIHDKIINYADKKGIRNLANAVGLFLIFYGSIGFVSKYFFSYTLGTVIALFGLFIILIFNKPKFNFSAFLTTCLLVLLSTFLGFYNHDAIKEIGFDAVSMCIVFVLVCIMNFDSFKKAFLNLFLFTSAFSIMVWVICSLWPEVIPMLPKLPRDGYYYNLFFCIIGNPTTKILRLYGFVWEPGAYQTFLNIAILIAGLQKHNRFLNLAILYTALILTFSTTGYIVGILNVIILIFAVNINNKKLIKRYIIVAAGSFVVLFIGATATGVTSFVFEKILGLFDGISSGDSYTNASTRIDSIYYPLVAFFNHPLFGVGKTGLNNIVAGLPHSILACTPANYLAKYGIIYSAIIGACWYKFIKLIVGKNRFVIIAGLTSFLLSIITEQYVSCIVMNMLIMYGSTLLLESPIFKRQKKHQELVALQQEPNQEQ